MLSGHLAELGERPCAVAHHKMSSEENVKTAKRKFSATIKTLDLSKDQPRMLSPAKPRQQGFWDEKCRLGTNVQL